MRCATSVVRAAAALAVIAACGAGSAQAGHAGPAPGGAPAPIPALAPAPASGSGDVPAGDIRTVDWRWTLLADPTVGQGVKETLSVESCSVCRTPVVTYRDLTGDGAADAMVEVDSGGTMGTLAAYVYSFQRGRLTQIFAFDMNANQDQSVWKFGVQGQGGDLLLRLAVYKPDDANCCPSSHRIIRYHWNGTRMVAVGAPRTEYPSLR